MAMITVWQKIDEASVVQALQDTGGKLDGADSEVVLDFSSVNRIDASGLMALEQFANKADDKSVKVALQGVNVSVYKVLKLMKLAPRFAFVD
ncbi:MAG: sodium-independent anion transporter [Terriglobales bacterium]